MQHLNYFTFLNNRLSIQTFLSICLLILISCAISILGVFNYFQIKNQTEELFKMQMVNSAKAIDALIFAALQGPSHKKLSKILQSNSSVLDNTGYNLAPKVAELDNVYQNAFAFQIYDTNTGKLLLHSTTAPSVSSFPLSNNTFRTITLESNNGLKLWNVFSINSRYKPYRIVVFVNSDFKHQVFYNLFKSTLWDLFVLYVFLLLSIFFVIQFALRPLSDMRRAIAKKDPRKLAPIAFKTAPPEITPLLNQLNILFRRFNEVLEKEKRFAGDAAHELKTPLAALKKQAEVALNLNDIDAIKVKIKNIIESTDRYFYIINQLLTLSRLEPQQELPDKKSLNLNIIAENQLAELAMLALNKNIELVFMPSKTAAEIYGSQALLSILFRNLIDNAIRYTPVNGKVSIYSDIADQHVIFEVIDNGPGIGKQELDRIFDRFYRKTGTGQSGSGLGLSIVQEIVRLHDGEIIAKPSEKEKGLNLVVKFPLLKS